MDLVALVFLQPFAEAAEGRMARQCLRQAARRSIKYADVQLHACKTLSEVRVDEGCLMLLIQAVSEVYTEIDIVDRRRQRPCKHGSAD